MQHACVLSLTLKRRGNLERLQIKRHKHNNENSPFCTFGAPHGRDKMHPSVANLSVSLPSTPRSKAAVEASRPSTALSPFSATTYDATEHVSRW